MEFKLAAEGDTAGLRRWLIDHPERINIPCKGPQFTLLYTAISNSRRPDLAAIQSGKNYLEVIRMLCEEFHADVAAPSGGGRNTPAHLAAQIGADDILAYLVRNCHAPLKPNVFGETPLQVAQRANAAGCVAILRQEEAARSQRARPNSEPPASRLGGRDSRVSAAAREDAPHSAVVTTRRADPAVPVMQLPPNPRSPLALSSNAVLRRGPAGATTTAAAANSYHTRFGSLKIEDDSDDDDDNLRQKDVTTTTTTTQSSSLPAGGSASLRASTQQTATAPQPSALFAPLQMASSDGSNVASPTNSSGLQCMATPARQPPTSAPHRTVLRAERDISHYDSFSNMDLQQFRRAFGNGYTYTQCHDHYEIRGLLPYFYRTVEYFTPVVVLIFAPRSSAFDVSREGRQDSSATLSSLSNEGQGSSSAPNFCYSRYRVLLDLSQLGDYCVSCRAEYLDPVSGAFIPSPCDALYTSLVAFLRGAVIANFGRVAPLIVKTSAYAFARAAPISRIGASSDTYRYRHSQNAAGYIQAVVRKRDAARMRTFRILQDLSRFGDGLLHYDMHHHQVRGALPVVVESPSVLLTVAADPSAAPTPPASGSTGSPSKDVQSSTAIASEVVLMLLVRIQFSPDAPERGAYLTFPSVFLQDAKATGELSSARRRTVECFRPILLDDNSGEVKPECLEPVRSEWGAKGSLLDLLLTLQRLVYTMIERYVETQRKSPPASATNNGSSLDDYFGGTAPASSSSVASSSGPLCIMCYSRQKNIVLLPCRHLVLCHECAVRGFNQSRRGEFLCPLCRAPTTEMREVYL